MQLKFGDKIRFRPSHIVVRKNESWVQSFCLMVGEVFWFFPTRLYELIRIPIVTVAAHTGMAVWLLLLFGFSRLLLLLLGLAGYLCYADDSDAKGHTEEIQGDKPDLE